MAEEGVPDLKVVKGRAVEEIHWKEQREKKMPAAPRTRGAVPRGPTYV